MQEVENVLRSLPHGQLILDVPCGTGRFLPLLLRAEHRVVGMDISADMLKKVPYAYRWERISLHTITTLQTAIAN